MGFVWTVMLAFDNEEWWVDGEDEARENCEPLDRINAWIGEGELVSLVGPTYADDAGYGMDANLYGGGYKHFDIEQFIEVVRAQNWKERGNVQLWVRGGEEGMCEDPFYLIDLGPPPKRKTVTNRPKSKTKPKSRPKKQAKPAKVKNVKAAGNAKKTKKGSSRTRRSS